MFGQIWNHRTIRKYVIYFGTLFNDIYLTRDATANSRQQTMKVPLNYGPKDKFLARLQGNPNLGRDIAITLPRMSFEITGFRYAPERKLSSVGRVTKVNTSNPDQMNYQYNPIPYDIQFSLYVMVKNAEDGTRIVEQILPFFTPEFTATLNVNPDLGVKYDIPLTLNSIAQQDTYEGDFITRRAIIWTLNFTLNGYIFGPTRNQGVIKQAEVNIRIPEVDMDIANANNTGAVVEMTITPGLTSNGQPTSNSTLSIDKSLIKSTDNYGFIIDFQENY